MVSNIRTASISEEIYYSLERHGIFLEQKGYRKGKTETDYLLYTDQHIVKKVKIRRTKE